MPKMKYWDGSQWVTLDAANADTLGGTSASSYVLVSRTISAGEGLTGGGSLLSNRTISHADTSSQASVNNSGLTFIQDVTLDDFGHVTGLGSGSVTAGSGISISGTQITNSDRGSSQNIFKRIGNSSGTQQFAAGSNNDMIQFATGGILSLNFDSTNKRITYSASLSAGNGISIIGSTISHASTSSQSSVSNSGTTVIQSVTLDSFGHVTGLSSTEITKSSIGLGSVQNYSVASQSEAEAGTATNRYMTPQRTKQAIDALASPKAHTHSASDITSGTLSVDRIPTLPTTKLPSATTSAAGIVQLTTSRTSTSSSLALTASAMNSHRTSGDHDDRYYTKTQVESISRQMVPYPLKAVEEWSVELPFAFTDKATRTNMGASLSGNSKWFGGVLAPNGKIYGIPYLDTDILVIDPETETATRTNMGASLLGTSKWFGGVLAPNGKIYGIPYNATDILVIDPETETATRTNMGASLSGNYKWCGGILAPNGKIYGIPDNAADILVIDPETETATRTNMGASLSGNSKWFGGVLAPNGKIYGIPANATDILVIDPETGTATRTTMGADLSGSPKWYGGVLAPNGKIYGIPATVTDILVIDPETGTATRTTMGADLSGSSKWYGGVLAPNGKIYEIPHFATDILVIDPLMEKANLMPSLPTLLSPYLNKF